MSGFVAGSREPLLDLVEAAKRVGLPVKTLRSAIGNGHLRARQPRGQRKLYVLIEDLDEWATVEVKPAPRRPTAPVDPGKVRELRRRQAEPGSVARLDAIEERSMARR